MTPIVNLERSDEEPKEDLKAGSKEELSKSDNDKDFDEWQGVSREGEAKSDDEDDDDDTPDNYNDNDDNDGGVMMPVDASF